MGNLIEEAKSYDSSLKTIADLGDLQVEELKSLELQHGEGVDPKTQKVYKYMFVVVEDEEYRVPKSVMKDLKEILEANPNLKKFRVKKSGSGMATKYTVITM